MRFSAQVLYSRLLNNQNEAGHIATELTFTIVTRLTKNGIDFFPVFGPRHVANPLLQKYPKFIDISIDSKKDVI